MHAPTLGWATFFLTEPASFGQSQQRASHWTFSIVFLIFCPVMTYFAEWASLHLCSSNVNATADESLVFRCSSLFVCFLCVIILMSGIFRWVQNLLLFLGWMTLCVRNWRTRQWSAECFMQHFSSQTWNISSSCWNYWSLKSHNKLYSTVVTSGWVVIHHILSLVFL